MAQSAGRPAESMLEEIRAAQAVPALLEPADIAGAFLFRACDDARAITGGRIVGTSLGQASKKLGFERRGLLAKQGLRELQHTIAFLARFPSVFAGR